MCGIAGFLNRLERPGRAELGRLATAMASAVSHRGPDHAGVWVDPEAGIALGHRRLSIIDLSPAGAQPMQSRSGRYVITYNGEIYNFQALRRELEACGQVFRGHSDTEVLLVAIDCWGVKEALQRVNGMFAFAMWDCKARQLTLARDRVGKKPLYYGWCGDAFLFGSELKALRCHPRFDGTIDRDALCQFLQFGWVPEPRSIYKCISKLPPGSFIQVSTGSADALPDFQTYWSAIDQMVQAQRDPFVGPYQQAVERLEALLFDAVAARMVADVPLGALLSGGVDSTTVVALMQKIADRPVKTFCIGFREPKYNEAEYAANIAGFLGTDHHELYATPAECLAVLTELASIYDEPFGDVSQVATVLVSRLARQEVKVVLSGDGGDELFAGYSHYMDCLTRWRWLSRLPAGLQGTGTELLAWLARTSQRGVTAERLARGEKISRWRRSGAKLSRRSHVWAARSPEELLIRHRSRHPDPTVLVPGATSPANPVAGPDCTASPTEALRAMALLDFVSYLPGDILVKVDRATMSVGLEARCPILDRNAVEFAWRLPMEILVQGGHGKRILRDVLARHVPREMTDRPKKGFGVPIEEWLRGPLRSWAEDLLAVPLMARQGLLDPQAVRELWQQHLAGWRNHGDLLWAILMFQKWLEGIEHSGSDVDFSDLTTGSPAPLAAGSE